MNRDLDAIVARYAAVNSLQQLFACARDYEAAGAPLSPGSPKIRLAVTGNYSTQMLAKGFPLALAARNVGVDLYEGPYNHWQIELLDAGSALYSFNPTHILLALTSVELAYGSLRSVEAVTAAITAAVDAACKATDAHITVTLPEPLVDEISDSCGAYAWRRGICNGLRAALSSTRVTLIDVEPLIRDCGARAWFDDRFYDTAKIPFHPDRTPALLGRLADAIASVVNPRCKLIVVDLDDTLWGGRVGDDGFEGIDLDPAGQGRHFLRLQAFLKALQADGVVLAVASKNNLRPVQEVFANRPEMILQFADFAAAEIHWEPKSTSLARILDRLKLSTAGVVFLDDNPVERAEVRSRFPNIEVPELPDDPARRVPMLIATGRFDRRVTTQESRDRNRMYAENAERDTALQAAGNLDEFLRRLDMVLEICGIDEARDRALELIQKTNQFNLTTRRYNWSELAAILQDGFGRCYRLKDKFGDNGIISVAAIARDSGLDARIDLWLMSCRVLGRKVEEAILADLAAGARALGARRLIGEYLPTAKNELVCDLYPRLGFTEKGEHGGRVRYELSLDDPRANAGVDFIRAVSRSPSAGEVA
ncbi:MAG: HAD-IIIC family phosphatase [Xanthobacteraceae bacterium]